MSDEHFTVDGTLIEAWAGQKSFKRKDQPPQPPPEGSRNVSVDFHGEHRAHEKHQSRTDAECRQFKKSKGAAASFCYMGHVLMENRNGLVIKPNVKQATCTAERDAAVDMVQVIPGSCRLTLGGDKNDDARKSVDTLRSLNFTPHVAQNDTNRKSAIDGLTTRHPGYVVTMNKRKRVEEIFGWLNRGRYAQNKTSGHPSRGLDVYLLPGCLQSGQNATDGARSISSKADLRPLSVFRPQTPQ